MAMQEPTYYRLTDDGGAAPSGEIDRMRANAALAAARLRRTTRLAFGPAS
jgi:hypothetical protein